MPSPAPVTGAELQAVTYLPRDYQTRPVATPFWYRLPKVTMREDCQCPPLSSLRPLRDSRLLMAIQLKTGQSRRGLVGPRRSSHAPR